MKLEVIKEHIISFIVSTSPEVMAINGPWGIGKTYTWNRMVEEARKTPSNFQKHYVYLSLFGVNDIQTFKQGIISSINPWQTGKSYTDQTQNSLGNKFNISEKILHFLPSWLKKHTKEKTGNDNINLALSILNSLAFDGIEKALVCIDDLERASLNVKEILGIISNLKEIKNCKIVLLLNEDEEKAKQFISCKEKVVDLYVKFDIKSEEVANIAVNGDEIWKKSLRKCSSDLGNKNIRVIKQTERCLIKILDVIGLKDENIVEQVVRSTTLFTYCYNVSPQMDLIPDLQFLANLTSVPFWFEKEQKKDTITQKKLDFLHSYGFRAADFFDLTLMEIVDSGLIDKEKLIGEIVKLKALAAKRKSADSYFQVWDYFKDRFDGDCDSFSRRLANSIYENFENISIRNIDQSIKLLRMLENDTMADEVATFTCEKIELSGLDIERATAYGDLEDSYLKQIVTEKYEKTRILRPFLVLMDLISLPDGYNTYDLEELSRYSVEDFYKYFKTTKGRHLNTGINRCLGLPKENVIYSMVVDALKRIGRECLLNQVRIKTMYKIDLEDEP